MIFPFGRASKSKQSVVGRLEGSSQSLIIESPALTHVARFRQLSPWAKEAGGQLFGTIDAKAIRVHEATGPYTGDERQRCRYRSNAEAAQRAIDEAAKRGLLYIGEWHTHAEDCPSASTMDDDAMQRLIANSRLNSNALLLMIVGRTQHPVGLGVWAVSSTVARWELCAGGA